MRTLTAHISLLLACLIRGTAAGPGMGAAQVVLKFAQKCDFTLPTFQPLEYRLASRHGRPYLNLTTTFRYKFSDKYGFSFNAAVKKIGRWVPNFFKSKGQGMCSGLKIIEQNVYNQMAKQLNAPEPYTCPLPAGTITLVDYTPDMDGLHSLAGSLLPLGEFKVEANLTHKMDVVGCILFYIEMVSQKAKKKG